MDLDAYFNEITANIRARPISWDAHQRAGTLTAADVKTIKAIDRQRPEKRREIITQVNFFHPLYLTHTHIHTHILSSLFNPEKTRGKKIRILDLLFWKKKVH